MGEGTESVGDGAAADGPVGGGADEIVRSGGSPYRLLQTAEFVAELERGLKEAERRVFIQLMTFDGDDAGLRIADLLVDAAERGVEVRLLVDCFVFRFVSDQPIGRKPEAREEAEATWAMYDRLRAAGIELTFTHPHGPLWLFSLARNHKKMVVIDDHLYLGGVNVSDHNFSWHDFMVRVDVPETVAAAVDDFDHTRSGGRRSVNTEIITNAELEKVFDGMVLEATESITLASPYALDVGLPRLMARSKAADKHVIISGRNNFLVYRAMTPFLKWRLRRARTRISTYSNFSHSKFLLVDDRKLLIGSSNFGRHSFWCNQEIGLLITDTDFIQEFKAALMRDTEPMTEHLPAVKIAFGALVSYVMYGCVLGLRYTVAHRVPNLSRR